MVSPISTIMKDRIAAVRIRRGFRGKAVLQVQYYMKQLPPWPQPGRSASKWDDAGVSAWADVDCNNVEELAQVVAMLNKTGKKENTTKGKTNDRADDDKPDTCGAEIVEPVW